MQDPAVLGEQDGQDGRRSQQITQVGSAKSQRTAKGDLHCRDTGATFEPPIRIESTFATYPTAYCQDARLTLTHDRVNDDV